MCTIVLWYCKILREGYWSASCRTPYESCETLKENFLYGWRIFFFGDLDLYGCPLQSFWVDWAGGRSIRRWFARHFLGPPTEGICFQAHSWVGGRKQRLGQESGKNPREKFPRRMIASRYCSWGVGVRFSCTVLQLESLLEVLNLLKQVDAAAAPTVTKIPIENGALYGEWWLRARRFRKITKQPRRLKFVLASAKGQFFRVKWETPWNSESFILGLRTVWTPCKSSRSFDCETVDVPRGIMGCEYWEMEGMLRSGARCPLSFEARGFTTLLLLPLTPKTWVSCSNMLKSSFFALLILLSRCSSCLVRSPWVVHFGTGNIWARSAVFFSYGPTNFP